MSNYAESEKKIDSIRRQNESMFRMAISHLMDVGIRHLTEENINITCDEIMKQDDSHSFMTNEFQCELIRMAGELAQINHIDLLVYISRYVVYDVGDNAISYDRAIEMTQDCIDWITYDVDQEDARNDLNAIGFDEDELKILGYGYLIKEEE